MLETASPALVRRHPTPGGGCPAAPPPPGGGGAHDLRFSGWPRLPLSTFNPSSFGYCEVFSSTRQSRPRIRVTSSNRYKNVFCYFIFGCVFRFVICDL
jgi:hypothetical protein